MEGVDFIGGISPQKTVDIITLNLTYSTFYFSPFNDSIHWLAFHQCLHMYLDDNIGWQLGCCWMKPFWFCVCLLWCSGGLSSAISSLLSQAHWAWALLRPLKPPDGKDVHRREGRRTTGALPLCRWSALPAPRVSLGNLMTTQWS